MTGKIESNKIIALVPMKGHSERVPGKNIRMFGSEPLFFAILRVLERSDYVEKILIDTDSVEIGTMASTSFKKVVIIERPNYLRGDFVPMNDIIGYDIGQSDGQHFLQTHSTNPLLTTQTIDVAIERYFSVGDKYDSLFTVNKWQTRLYWDDGKPINHNPDELIRTQDLPVVYEENSALYLFSKNSFRRAGNKRIGLKPYLLEMNKTEGVDIDDEDDFKLAEALYRALRQPGMQQHDA